MIFATAAMPAARSRLCAPPGGRRGFGVEQIAPFVIDGVRVSSTAVRERLERARLLRRGAPPGPPLSNDRPCGPGQAAWANARVSRPRICGSCAASPRCGAVLGGAGARHRAPSRSRGVASLGTRPTVNGVEPLLEVHVFDFSGDLYGRLIEVEFVAKLRDEVKFDSLDSMVAQMKIDAARGARAVVEGG